MRVVFCALLICLLGFQQGTCYTDQEHANAHSLIVQYLEDNLVVNQGIVTLYQTNIQQEARTTVNIIGENLSSLNVPAASVTEYLDMSAQCITNTKKKMDTIENRNNQMWSYAEKIRCILAEGPGADLGSINHNLDQFAMYAALVSVGYDQFNVSMTYETEGLFGLNLLEGLEGPLVDETKTLLSDTRANFLDTKSVIFGIFQPYEETFGVVYDAVKIIALEE